MSLFGAWFTSHSSEVLSERLEATIQPPQLKPAHRPRPQRPWAPLILPLISLFALARSVMPSLDLTDYPYFPVTAIGAE